MTLDASPAASRSASEPNRSIPHIAALAHEANRRYCAVMGDFSQLPWERAAVWQQQSAIEAVQKALDGATPEELHDSWCAARWREGWRYGEAKDAEAKTHPCLVPYDQLPEQQRRKDALFAGVVRAMAEALAL